MTPALTDPPTPSVKRAKGKKATKAEKAAKTKAAAEERAAAIREANVNRRNLRPGAILNGEEGWRYYAAPPDDPGRTRCEARLTDLGYEPAPDVKMVGIHRGMIWKIPKSIADELHAARAERTKAKK
tara:strand:- start:116 stop:496 length:381 start_codon:yes stop_codon:yes gene_type:complete